MFAAGASTLVSVIIALLVLLGLTLIGLAIWVFQTAEPESPVLGPLGAMSARRFRFADPEARKRRLDSVRPTTPSTDDSASPKVTLDSDEEPNPTSAIPIQKPADSPAAEKPPKRRRSTDGSKKRSERRGKQPDPVSEADVAVEALSVEARSVEAGSELAIEVDETKPETTGRKSKRNRSRATTTAGESPSPDDVDAAQDIDIDEELDIDWWFEDDSIPDADDLDDQSHAEPDPQPETSERSSAETSLQPDSPAAAEKSLSGLYELEAYLDQLDSDVAVDSADVSIDRSGDTVDPEADSVTEASPRPQTAVLPAVDWGDDDADSSEFDDDFFDDFDLADDRELESGRDDDFDYSAYDEAMGLVPADFNVRRRGDEPVDSPYDDDFDDDQFDEDRLDGTDTRTGNQDMDDFQERDFDPVGNEGRDQFWDDDYDGTWDTNEAEERRIAQDLPPSERRRERQRRSEVLTGQSDSGEVPSQDMSTFDPEDMIDRFRERAAAVRRRPLPPVAGEERQEFIAQAKLDYQDFAMIGDAQVSIEDGVLVLRVDLRG